MDVDGDIHDLQRDEDARREKVLSASGLRIVRFRNDEVVRDMSPMVVNFRHVGTPSVRWTSTLKGTRPPNTTMKI